MKQQSENKKLTVAIIGGGPAGLAAAEALSKTAAQVQVYDAMPSVGRKFLYAGKSGLNLTHAEPLTDLLARFGEKASLLKPCLEAFLPSDIRKWADDLGAETFIGSSGHVFPKAMKAAPLLKAWLGKLKEAGITFNTNHRWEGWTEDRQLIFNIEGSIKTIQADAVVLALGGKSWRKLGSDGKWTPILRALDISIQDFKPANCGFNVDWSDFFMEKYAGWPIKSVAIKFKIKDDILFRRRGEFVVSKTGVEGSLIYAASAMIRDEIERQQKSKTVYLDLLPDLPIEKVIKKLSKPRGSASLSNFMRKQLRIQGVKMGLIHEFVPSDRYRDPKSLAESLKSLPVPFISARPIDEAISTAGGVSFDALNNDLMLTKLPGVFCAGEMIDWEAPTGGYLLTACFATGRAAGNGVANCMVIK